MHDFSMRTPADRIMDSLSSHRNTAVATLSRRLRAGGVFRREELAENSNAVDRHLKQLQASGRVKKLSYGLYYVPRHSAFGELPPDDKELVAAFLRSEDFLLLSPACYNTLELGATQLYNRTVVYNHKRHGHFTFGNRTFDFRMKPKFPRSISQEFLFVDLLNNIEELVEERDVILSNAPFKARDLEHRRLMQATTSFGNVATKKLIKGWLNA
jgi:hypothetical protein